MEQGICFDEWMTYCVLILHQTCAITRCRQFNVRFSALRGLAEGSEWVSVNPTWHIIGMLLQVRWPNQSNSVTALTETVGVWLTLSLTFYLAVNLYNWYYVTVENGDPENYQGTALKQEYNFNDRYKLCNNAGRTGAKRQWSIINGKTTAEYGKYGSVQWLGEC